MKRAKVLALMMFLLPLSLSPAAYADTVNVSLTNPVQYVSGAGGVLTYDLTVSAPISNGAEVFLNSDSFNVDSPLTLDDADFFSNAPFFLNPGDIYTFDAFQVTVPPGTTGSYAGSFSVVGGADGGASTILGTVDFTAAVTPEPSSLALLGTGLAGLVGLIRRRKTDEQ